MNLDNKEILMECVKNGSRVQEPLIGIKGFLNSAKMGLYAPICCNRIEAAGLIDGIHVFKDSKSNKNIILDAIGFKKCQEIIEGYIEPEQYKEELNYFQHLSDYVKCLNNELYIVRNCSKKKLRELYQEAQGLKGEKGFDIEPELFVAELKSRRKLLNKLQIFKRLLLTFCLITQFQVKFKDLPVLVKMAWRLSGNDEPQYDGGTYYMALMRFQVNHPKYKKPERLNRDDLKKYIYLGVKAYGKEYFMNNHRSKIHSCEEIEWIYKGTHEIMKAIGILTPTELLHLFPVTKDFKGGRFGSKDYFWTIEKINEMSKDKPIGTERDVANVLWDYVNKDTEFFFLNWHGSLVDLRDFCVKEEPLINYYDRQNKVKGKSEKENVVYE